MANRIDKFGTGNYFDPLACISENMRNPLKQYGSKTQELSSLKKTRSRGSLFARPTCVKCIVFENGKKMHNVRGLE